MLAGRGRNGLQPLTHGPGSAVKSADALISWAVAHGADGPEAAKAATEARERTQQARKQYAAQQHALRGYRLRKSLEPVYTQLAMNGSSGPLADQRVRRAVARALDRKEIANEVLKPLGLPAQPPGSHLALAGQQDYKDNSGAIGDHDPAKAQALLADAGFTAEGAREITEKSKAGSKADSVKDSVKKDKAEKTKAEEAAKAKQKADKAAKAEMSAAPAKSPAPSKSTADDAKAGRASGNEKHQTIGGAYAPKGTPAPAAAAAAPKVIGKKGKPLSLRFVLPAGPGSKSLNTVGDKITQMLDAVGIRTEITQVDGAGYFKDHIASGDYDLALYSWPATRLPGHRRPPDLRQARSGVRRLAAGRPELHPGRHGPVDQLFDRRPVNWTRGPPVTWSGGGRPDLGRRRLDPALPAPGTRGREAGLANAGAFGFETPRYQDIGFLKLARKP